jgi:phosphoesterase RecJ-like protein
MDFEDWLSGKALILTHKNADIDACSSVFALLEIISKLKPKAQVDYCFINGANKGGRKVLESFNMKEQVLDEIDTSKYDKIILVDCPVPELPEALQTKNIFTFDHHYTSESNDVGIVDDSAVSTTQILYNYAVSKKLKLSKDFGKAILFGIISDTGSMRFAQNDTFELVHSLLTAYGLDYKEILTELASEDDFSERLAWLTAGQRIGITRKGDRAVVVSNVGCFESSAAQKLISLGADVALVVSRKGSETRISGRSSRRANVNLAEIFEIIAKKYDCAGGGHPMAAALTLKKEKDYKDKEKQILEHTVSLVKKQL